MHVKDVMTTDVVTLKPDSSLKDAARTLVERGISGLPVCDEKGRVVGVLSEADLLYKEAGPPRPYRLLERLTEPRTLDAYVKPDAMSVREAMTRPAVTIGSNRPLAEAARLLVAKRLKRLPVVDDGALVGIVTRADLVRAFARPDADIARELRDDVLARTLWIDPSDLVVDVNDGHVVLRGVVETKTETQLVERLAARVPGVVSVTSELTSRDRKRVRAG
ncbi:MAG TPA: CBS domain-containing protein [Gaiellaceae bacterium]|jgi:CBS domain-containing protein